MNPTFERKVQAAAVAGWWVVLLAAILTTVSWLAYLSIVPAQPEWLHNLWGENLSWEYIQNVWFWAIVIFKLMAWVMVMAALWLTLWARQLRKASRTI
ncbi:MAG TPA: hypothetical protein VGJ16_14185 [Pirellulales bacterium]